jgi:hypothetical protein
VSSILLIERAEGESEAEEEEEEFEVIERREESEE